MLSLPPEAFALTDDPDICVLMNARSGRGRKGARAAELEALLADRPRWVLRTVPRGGALADAVTRARSDGFPTVVAAGGDGTVNAVAAGLAGTDRRLGVAPLGTFNFFARSLGLPEDLGAALDAIERPEARSVPVGEVNGRVFLNNASLGAYPAILRRRERIYARVGRSRAAAAASVLATLAGRRGSVAGTLAADGAERPLRTPLAFVALNPFQLDHYGLDGQGCLEGGRLALFLAARRGRLGLIRSAMDLALARAESGRDFHLVCAETVEIRTRRPRQTVALDGERARLESPFRFRIRHDALRVAAGDAA